MSIAGSLQEDLFGDNQAQDLQQVRDVMNAQEEVSEPSIDDSNTLSRARRMTILGLMHQLRTSQS
jgi:hypothetical protein